jgi:hypothetical protein
MAHPQHPGRMPRPLAQPQLPAFCRTRRPITTTVRLRSLRQLQWLLWLVLALLQRRCWRRWRSGHERGGQSPAAAVAGGER